MLSAIHGKVNLCITKVLRLIVRKKENGTVSNTSTHLSLLSSFLFTTEHTLVKVDAGYDFFHTRLVVANIF